MKSENKNFLFNIVYQLLTFIIPLLTIPYISRVLGVDNIGIYSYTYSVVYMFMLVAMLGVNNYGNRAVATVRDNKDELSKTFLSIYGLQLMTSALTLLSYLFYLCFFCDEHRVIACIQGLFLLSTCIDINWFYLGIEKFKLTIFRNLIIKISSLVLVFLLVKTRNDLWIYTTIMSGATLLSQIFLISILPRFIRIKKIELKDILVHFKGVCFLFIPVLAFGIYKVMDKTMLGALGSITQLGYYENAEKVMNIPAAIIAALGTVMLPRMSYIMTNGENNYKAPIASSMKLAMKLAMIMCGGIILVSDELVPILFGEEFLNSKPILILLSVTILASAWANVIRTQFLIPLKEDKKYIFSTIGAALINLGLNCIFIPMFGGIGACIGTIAAEFFVAIYQTIVTWNQLDYAIYIKNMCTDAIKTLIIISIAGALSFCVDGIYLKFCIKFIASVIIFAAINYKYIKYEFLGKPM